MQRKERFCNSSTWLAKKHFRNLKYVEMSSLPKNSAVWRQLGFSYLQYLGVSGQVLRKCLKVCRIWILAKCKIIISFCRSPLKARLWQEKVCFITATLPGKKVSFRDFVFFISWFYDALLVLFFSSSYILLWKGRRSY